MSNLCPQCGAPVDANSTKCQYCGAAITPQAAPAAAPAAAPVVQQPQVVYVPVQNASTKNPAISNSWPIKNKLVAALLAILLGALGAHKFYLGNTSKGLLYLVFCWTYIPGILGIVEGVQILASNDENFQLKYKCRIEQ